MLLMRSQKGIDFSATAPAVHAVFFMVGSVDQRHFHLVSLSAIAGIVQSANFESDWLAAPDVAALRQTVIAHYRET